MVKQGESSAVSGWAGSGGETGNTCLHRGPAAELSGRINGTHLAWLVERQRERRERTPERKKKKQNTKKAWSVECSGTKYERENEREQ